MTDQRIVALGALVGAVAGAAVTYFVLTEPGRRAWALIQQHADDAMQQMLETQRVALRLAQHVDEGMRDWRAFKDTRQQTIGAV